MGVAMTKTHPLTHLHMISNAQPVAWKPHSRFQSSWSFDQLLIEKQLRVDVAMAKPHPLPYSHLILIELVVFIYLFICIQ